MPEAYDPPNILQSLVFSDACTQGWIPALRPFITLVLTFEDLGRKTRYTARVFHWSVEDKKSHEERGFHQGWGQCADQLAGLLQRI